MNSFAAASPYPHVPISVGQWRIPDKMLGPSIQACVMLVFLVSTNLLYLVFGIGRQGALFIYTANMFWMIVVTCSIGLLGWLRVTARTYDMSALLLATIVMGGSWCILFLNSMYLGISVYLCRFCSAHSDHEDLDYCKFLGLSSVRSPPEVSVRPAKAWLSVACTLLFSLLVAIKWTALHLRLGRGSETGSMI